MGNSESQCCEMCGNDKNSSICETSQDPQASHMVDVSMKQLDQKSAPDQTFTIDKTDSNIESCQISSNKTDVSDSPCPSSHQYAQELDPRSPSDAITRTPICISKPKSLEEIMKDPRSPTVGIDRTPINLSHVENSRSASDECYLANAYKAEELNKLEKNLSDPRSPSAEINRTPLKFADAPDHVDEALQASIDLGNVSSSTPLAGTTSDEQNCVLSSEGATEVQPPSNESPRTPMKPATKDNLRRKVLITNALMTPPPAANVQRDADINEGTASETDLPETQPGEGGLSPRALLDVCAANRLNVSRSSSLLASCGSAPANISAEEVGGTDEASSVDCSPKRDRSQDAFCDDALLLEATDHSALLDEVEDAVECFADDVKDEAPENEKDAETEIVAIVETEATLSNTVPDKSVPSPASNQSSSVVTFSEDKLSENADVSVRSAGHCMSIVEDSGEGDSVGRVERPKSQKKPKSSIPVPTMKRGGKMAAGTDELLRRRKSSSAILASARKQSDCADQQANRSPLTVLGHKNSPEIRFRAFQKTANEKTGSFATKTIRRECGKEN